MLLKTENFEGPIGTLLDLIERKKMPISSVSLAGISGQFIDYLKTFESLPYAGHGIFHRNRFHFNADKVPLASAPNGDKRRRTAKH